MRKPIFERHGQLTTISLMKNKNVFESRPLVHGFLFETIRKALDVACGQFHTTALTADGSLWICGFQTAEIAKRRALANEEEYDELDLLSRFIPQPERVDIESSQLFHTDGEEIVKIKAGWGTNVAITNQGNVYEYDWDEPPRRMKGLENIFVHDIGLGWQHTIVIGEER